MFLHLCSFCSHVGVSVPSCTADYITRRGLCLGVSVQGVSVQGSVSGGGLCPGGSLFRGRGLCLGGLRPRGSLSRGVSVWGSLFRGVSVWRVSFREPPYGNKQVVRILLECILVLLFLYQLFDCIDLIFLCRLYVVKP